MQLVVVVMSMRVGSTWFVETYLSQHPQVHVVSGEMFHGMPMEDRTVSVLEDALAECMRASQQKKSITNCAFKAPSWFWGTNTSDARFIANARFFKQQGARVIHLYRRNILKQALSLLEATTSKVWGITASKQTLGPTPANGTKSPVLYTATEMMHAVLFYLATWQETCRFINTALPGRDLPPAFELAYEDLSALQRRHATLTRVYNFLGIDASLKLEKFHEMRVRQSDSSGGALNLKQVMKPGEDVLLMHLLKTSQYNFWTRAYERLTMGLSDEAFTGPDGEGASGGRGELGQC